MNIEDIVASLDGVFQPSKRKARPYRSRRGRRVLHSYRSESLEDRCLLALVGLDLGVGGSTPTNWTPHAGTGSASLSGLIDESGSTTLINVAIAVDSQPGETANFLPPADELPLHSQSLAGIDGAYADSGNIEFTFSGLTASVLYEIYVFGGGTNPAAASNQVTISGGGTSFSFEQPHDEQQLIVNRKRGDMTLPLGSYAEFMTADASGEILVRVDNGGAEPTQFFGVAGIAIQQATPGEVRLDDLTVDEGAGTASVIARLTSPANGSVTLTLATADGTATAGQDYQSNNAQVTIPDGATFATGTLNVAITDDQSIEPDETFRVFVQSVTAGSVTDSSDSGTISIVDNDSRISLSFGATSISEGAGIAATIGTASRNTGTALPLDVTLKSSDVTAANVVGTVTIPAGETSVIFSVVALDDVFVDGTQTAIITASAVDHRSASVSVDVTDDDVPTLTLTAADPSVGEADGTSITSGTVSRNTGTSGPLQVMLMSDDTTEINVAQTVTIPANEMSVSFSIDAVDDSEVDGEQTTTVIASAPGFIDGSHVIVVSDNDGAVTGQKWHDLNGDGIKDADEPGLDGWMLQLLSDAGVVVAETSTGSVDVNNDGQIDAFTESGLYSLTTVAGAWSILEVQQQGWRQTTQSADSQAALLYDLDQQLNLRFTGNYFEDWGRRGEKWMLSSDGWYYITPDGNLYQWDRESQVPLLGQLVATLSPHVHENPMLLHDALPPDFTVVTFAGGETVMGMDFGIIPTGRIEGRSWNDIDADHIRTATEPWLNGWTVHLEDAAGNIVASTLTADVDRDNDELIDPVTESGWYSFDAIVPGNYRVNQISQPQWQMADTGGQHAQQAYALDQQLDFLHPAYSFFDWGGLRETWFWSRRESWHFITPDGSLYRWDGSSVESLTGTMVAQFDSQYWERPGLIYDAADPDPDPFRFSIVGQTLRDVDFGNTFGQDGSGTGNLAVTYRGSTVTVFGDERANSMTVYSDSQGRVIV
ncbi:MAG: hypothetical protein GY878_15645 [Fuerstiella sp.]|nr:hypothetical protein [Fuerstiella sp.]